jgi:hypothetical protein
MRYEEEIRLESASHQSLGGSDGDAEDKRRPWRAPVVTRLSVERTLFHAGSPIDGASSGSTGG